MSEIAAQTGREVAGGSGRGSSEPDSGDAQRAEQSTTDQAKEKVQEGAEVVQDKAQELKGQAGDWVRHELDNRSTQVGSQLQGTAEAMRRTGELLVQEGKDGPAQAARLVAERAERLASYLSASNADRMLRDVENFARRQPWLVAAGGATLGFLMSRFLKASSSGRYRSGNGSGMPRQPWQPDAASSGVARMPSSQGPATTPAIPKTEPEYASVGSKHGGSDG